MSCLSYPADHPLWHHLDQGHPVLTVNRRLARVLMEAYARRQTLAGVNVWPTPVICPSDEWFARQWRVLDDDRILLDGWQSRALWSQVIEQDLRRHGDDLLQLAATVRQVDGAHGLCCAYLVEEILPSTPEHDAFVRWRTHYLQRCRQEQWLDAASLPDVVESSVLQGAVTLPESMVWVGFDTLTPRLNRVKASFERCGCAVHLSGPQPFADATVTGWQADDEMAELRHAARWARHQLEAQVGTVAVVVPELERLQSQVERIFKHELATSPFPERIPVDAFNVSLGKPLAGQGMVTAALTLLQLDGPVAFDTLSYLLRCPWFKGAVSEAAQRVQWECRLRRDNVLRLSLRQLVARVQRDGFAGSAAVSTLFSAMEQFVQLDDEVSPAQWAERIAAVLRRVGWPGEQVLDSQVYQVLAAWHDKVLATFSRLGAVLPQISRQRAVSLLASVARDVLFQSKAQDNRLQIIGLLETAGLSFDALWLCGATQRVLPGSVSFNPFLPVELQKKHQMPHSSCEHEAAYAQQLLGRLCQAAPQVAVSYARQVEGVECHVSPYLAQRLSWQALPAIVDTPIRMLAQEQLCDDCGEPLTTAQLQEAVSGGTALLKEQAQCPFKAFVHYRLGLRGLEQPQPGLTSRRRGDLLHRVLQGFWEQTQGLDQLLALDDEALWQRIDQHVDAVVNATPFAPQEWAVVGLERQRLGSLLREWLRVEEQRPPFSVGPVEERRQFRVGPLLLNTIPDRIDRLADGRHVVVDYKSGQVTAADLVGDVLFEPQLPVYALNGVEGDVAAVTFAQVRHGQCQFKGVAAEAALLPGVDGVEKCRTLPEGVARWDELLALWQRQLETTATSFAQGAAAVAPVHSKVCTYCDLKGLCRITLHSETRMTEVDDDDSA